MPNWKKVVVSGSAANLHSLNVSTDVTASNISSSGNIFGNLSENSSTSFKTVVVDPSTGQFYRTGSYGGGGGAGATPTLQEVTTEGNTTNQGLIVTGSTTFKPISSGNGGAIELTNQGYSGLDNPIMTFKDGQGNSNIIIGHRANDGQIQVYDQPDRLRTVLSANFSAFDPGSTTGNGTYFGLTSSMAPTVKNNRAYIKMYEGNYSGAPAYNFQLNHYNYVAGSGTIGLYGIMSSTSTAAPAIQITSTNADKVVNFGGPGFIHSNGKQNNYLKYGLQIGGGFTGTNANMPLTDGSLIMSGSGGSFSMKSVSSKAEIKTNNGATTLILGTTSSFTAVSASSYISASKFIGDGSQLTGISAGTNFTQSLFVSPSGDNSTAVVGDMSKPFASILAATGSANPGDTIIVYPGIYTPASQIIKDHVNYYFYPGAIVSGSIPLLSGTFEELNVRGHGIFDTNFNGDTINITANGVFECDTVRFGGLQSSGYAGAPKFAQDYTNYPNRNLTISGKFKYGKDGARTGNGLGGAGVSIGGGAIIANVDVHVSSSSGMPGIRLNSQYTDALINATVYANMGTALYSNQRISHTTIKGMYETGDQSTYYAIDLSPGYVGNFFIDATMIGAIKLATGGVGQSGVDVRGFQSCTNSPSSLGAVQLSSAGYYTLHHRIEASENIFYQTNTYAYTTYTGNAQIMSNNTGKMFDIQAGRFIWKGSAGDKEVRVNQNTVSGGELIIDSPLIHYGSSYPINRFCFNLTAGTLEINNKLIYHQNTTGSGIIDMSGGYLKLNGAQLIHADHTGSFAYAIDLNNAAHSGSILNNCFTNLTPFGPGSFTNEIVGGGTLFESHKLY